MIKSFMEFVQLKNEGIFDLFDRFKSKKKPPESPANNAPKSSAADNTDVSPVKKKKTIPLDTYDPYTAKYSPLTTGRSYDTYMSPEETEAAKNQFEKNKEVDLGKSEPAINYISQSQFSFSNGTKKIEDDIKNGRFSYDKNNVPKMMLYLLNNHLDGGYMPFFGSLVKNNAVNMIPYNLALRIMETYAKVGSGTTWTLKSFIARHLLEKTPDKIRNIQELNPIFRSLMPTEVWGTTSNTPSFLEHIKEEDIKDIWLKFFEKRPDLAQEYYKENGKRMRLNQKYKQTNDPRYQKPNDMENAISIIVGEKNESFNPCKKSLYDW